MKIRMKQKKIMALLLSFCMVFAALPVSAFAETQAAAADSEKIVSDSLQAGEQQNGQNEEKAEKAEDDSEGDYIENEYVILHEDFFEKNSNGGFSVKDNEPSELQQEITVAAAEVLDGDADIAVLEEGQNDGLALVRLEENVSESEQQAFVAELQSQDGVIAVEQNRTVHALETEIASVTADTYSSYQYALDSVRASEAWEMLDLNTTTPITVAVVDTGIDYTHPDLAGKVLEGKNLVDYNSSDQKYSSANYMDDNGHGTHVAGIIAAITGNNLGISGVTGSLDIQLLPAKVLDDDGNGTTYEVVNGIKYAVDNGADIINMSLGSQYASSLEEAAVNYAETNGVLCVAAAGNESTDVKYSYPANYDTVLSVGSVDKNDERSYFSNYGASLDVSAPGSAILSTIPESTAPSFKAKGYTVYGNSQDGYYAVLSGTSMASPYAAGVAAIYLATNSMADCADVREHLKNTARDVGDIGFDIDTGYGVVDAAAALGEPIRQIAVRIKTPTSGSELYQKTNIKLQVNTNMDIAKVCLYLNEVKDNALFDSFDVKNTTSLYEREWDTTQFSDGSYTLLAKAFDADGNPVGDAQSVSNINIQNRISNGYVLEVQDPLGKNADSAAVVLAGKDGDTWYLVYEGNTTDLGYDRIKLSADDEYESYNLGVAGSYKNADGVTSYYYYNIENPQKGEKIAVNTQTTKAQKAAFSMKDKDGKEINRPYVMLSACKDQYVLQDIDVWTMEEKTDIYVSPGLYELQGVWTPTMMAEPDYSYPAYYLCNVDARITESSANLILDCDNTGILRGSFDEGYEGLLQVEGKNINYSIPFFSGKITGKELYMAPGEYIVKGLVSKEVDGEIWSAVLQKADPVKVTKGSDETIHFSAQLKIVKFEPAANTLKTDENGNKYMYRGDVLRTVNNMSVSGDSVISGFSGMYPTFRIYKKNSDDSETLVYEVSDTWQTKGSTWDSQKNYIGDTQPEEGNYRAELTFDAGALGGKSLMEFDFVLKNRSEKPETDLNLHMGSQYTLPYAKMDLYYWSEDTQKWTAAGDSVITDSKGSATVVDENYITNADGINVAVVSYSARQKNGNAVPDSYNGYQLYYYETLQDLKDVDLSSAQSSVYFEVHDIAGKIVNSGNTRINVNLSLQSSGNGKLADAEPLPDVKIPAGTVYLPEGKYSYIYTNFTLSNEEYFICNTDEQINSSTEKILLDGSNTEEVKFTVKDGLKGSKIQPYFASMRNADDCSFILASNRTYHWSKGSYEPIAAVRTADSKAQLRYQLPKFNLDSEKELKIDLNLTGTINPDRSVVNINQSLSGKINIVDSFGNKLIGSEVKKGAVYVPVQPVVYTGKVNAADNMQSIVLDSYQSFVVAPAYYQGAGEYKIYAVYSINGEEYKTADAFYQITDGSSKGSLTVESDNDFVVAYNEDGSASIKINNGFEGYKKITVKIPASDYLQKLTFSQTRNGTVIAKNGIADTFNQAINTHQAAFQVKAGDVITVQTELLTK